MKTLTAVPLRYETGLFCSETLVCDEGLPCSDYGMYPAILDADVLVHFPGTFPGPPTFPGDPTFPGAGDNLLAADEEGATTLDAVPVT